jgi:hypothetical protein
MVNALYAKPARNDCEYDEDRSFDMAKIPIFFGMPESIARFLVDDEIEAEQDAYDE